MPRILCCLLILSLPSFGQFSSAIQGTVTDSSAAAVPDAKVTIKNTETGIVRETITSADGLYRLALLQQPRPQQRFHGL